MKRFLTGMLCAGILTSQPAVTYAAETSATPEAGHSETYSQASDIDSVKGWPAGPNIEGQSAVLMDAVTDTILYSKNAKDKLYPASITKIMTALLACEHLNMDDLAQVVLLFTPDRLYTLSGDPQRITNGCTDCF